jgi:excisionase family DNA binding protein
LIGCFTFVRVILRPILGGMNKTYLQTLEIPNKDTPVKYRLLTRKETADRLGVHKETIKRWQQNGKLPAIILNSRVTRYDPVIVEKFIASGMVG